MAGVEPEFHLINADGSAISDHRDTQEKPCYDQSAIMRRFDVISEICSTMTGLGWGPYQNDHEDANGQFEINWNYNDALTTADQLCFFKFMVKSIAEKHGLRATFMPKPFINLTGNGCHVHLSVWDASGEKNLFHDPKGEMGLSKLAYHFLGGLMHHAEALVAITNPTVNSYKRINAPVTLSGATWSPNTVTFGGNNRTHMVRIPDEGRTEFRLPDGAANPYLMMAGILAAGVHGVEAKMDPGQAARHRHVCRRPHGQGCQEAAAQPARCAAQFRGRQISARGARRGSDGRLSQAQAQRMEPLLPPPHPVGARNHARLLMTNPRDQRV